MTKEQINWDEFITIKEIKHPADLTLGDIGYFSDHDKFTNEDNTYYRGTCFGYCGDECFIRFDNGRRFTAFYKGCTYKITGQDITLIDRPQRSYPPISIPTATKNHIDDK